ncbi:MAG: hypothetical protein KatS3mg035_2098 [Bacteroidia bacterium]|nr:MAG: hypothetical protein KatS3mg035_2098 [Bacteroidia bacterium]
MNKYLVYFLLGVGILILSVLGSYLGTILAFKTLPPKQLTSTSGQQVPLQGQTGGLYPQQGSLPNQQQGWPQVTGQQPEGGFQNSPGSFQQPQGR